MKKFILSFLFFIPFISYGQNSSQLESFEKIKDSYSLVENGTKVRYSKIYENLGKSRETLKEGLVNFFKFRKEKCSDFAIQDVDSSYVVTFTVDYGYITGRSNLGHDYELYMVTNWRVDIKDNRLRVIVDLSDYTQKHLNKTGILQKLNTDVVPLVVVPPFKETGKKKNDEMYSAAFIISYNKTMSLFYYLGESFKMLIKKAPEASTDW